jgi:hypothetical protein
MIGLFVAMAAVGLAGWAADEPSDEQQAVGGLAFIDEVEVTIVNAEVFVRDKDGRPVTDLGIDDFRVSQDGEQRAITNFLLVNEEVSAPSRPEIQPIHIVVSVDDESLMPYDRNRGLGSLRRFLADSVRDNLERFIELAPDDPDAAIARELLSYSQSVAVFTRRWT